MYDGFDDNGWSDLAAVPDLPAPPTAPPPTADDQASGLRDAANAMAQVAGGYWLARRIGRRRARRRRDATGATTAPTFVAPSVAEPRPAQPERPAKQPTPARTDRHTQDRAVLVAACVELEDLLPQRALREKVARALRHAGVNFSSPVGERFDPDRHCAVGSAPTDDLDKHDHIASVRRPGVIDQDRELRQPEVIVWRYDALAEPGAAR